MSINESDSILRTKVNFALKSPPDPGWSKTDRQRQISFDNDYMWNLKKRYKLTYLQNIELQMKKTN